MAMALCRTKTISLLGQTITCCQKARIFTCIPCLIKWRYQKGIEPCPNRYGPLTNRPDYSFVDGRIVPISANSYRRLKRQEKFCEQIVTLNREIDFAIDRYNKMQNEIQANRKLVLDSKLKPKGDQLECIEILVSYCNCPDGEIFGN